MMCTCNYIQRANNPLQGLDRYALTVGAISGPTANLEHAFGTISPVVDLHGRQKAFGKNKPVNYGQWRQ